MGGRGSGPQATRCLPGVCSTAHLCSHRSRESPKLSQANGTPGIILAPQSCDGSPDPICKEAGEEAAR